MKVRLVGPSGQEVITPRGLGPNTFLNTRTLTETGTYRLEIDPATTGTGQVDVVVHDVPADTVVPATLGASAGITARGQNVFGGGHGRPLPPQRETRWCEVPLLCVEVDLSQAYPHPS